MMAEVAISFMQRSSHLIVLVMLWCEERIDVYSLLFGRRSLSVATRAVSGNGWPTDQFLF